MTLSNWKTQITAKGIDPNEAMRLLQDAQAQIDALRAALQPFADAAKHVRGAMYQQDGYVAGLNTVEEYHNARRVLGEAPQ